MTCLRCANGALRDAAGGDPKRDAAVRGMSKAGFVNCKASHAAATFYAADHTCAKFSQAPEAVLAARMAWAEKNGIA